MKKITLASFFFLLTILIYGQNPCPPISPLDCSDISVTLPFNLDFSSSVSNTILDGSGSGTGFTAVLEHSEARRSGDLPISNPNINGYEPSLLTVGGGTLDIVSQRGIAFLNPPASSNNNNQVNTLGVGLENITSPITIKTSLLNIVTGGGSAQSGIWFGYDEDNFVKLNVNNNNIELRVESAGVSPGQIQFPLGASGQDVILELEIDPNTLMADAYYIIGAGTRILLGSSSIPSDYFSGRVVGTSNMTFAGIYTTQRNGSTFTTSFDSFSIEEQSIVASADNDIVSFTLPTQIGNAIIDSNAHTVTLDVTNGTNLGALTPSITVSTDATISPLSGVAQDFSSPVVYTVMAQDNSTQDWTVTVTEASFTICSPISPLDCSDITVALPFNLDFSSSVSNTILDGIGLGTGFTAVLEHSEARRSGDLPISNSSINGYEPSLLSLTGGTLDIVSQRGIAFLNPPASSNNNNQVNTLGVGLENITSPITIKTSLLNIVTGGGSAQSGIWFGYDEDNFVKLNVNNNNIELRVESAGVSPGQIQFPLGASGQDVLLELEINPNTLMADAYYTIGAGTRILLGSSSIPSDYFSGRVVGTSNMTFAGIYTTQRNGSTFTTSFDSFSIDGETILNSNNNITDFTLSAQTGNAIIDTNTNTVVIQVANGTDVSALTPNIIVSSGATISPLSGVVQDFSSPVVYTVTAQDNSTQDWTVTVNIDTPVSTLCSPISTLDCSDITVALPLNLDFNSSVPNTILDGIGSGTGFTAVLEHSEVRRSGDLPISNLSINGYEPSLLTVGGGTLDIVSQGGISFLNPPASSNNNNQVNTLGVGLENITTPLLIKTSLLNIVTGGGSAQSGIWFGYDEDNFVKLNVNNNNVELNVESAGLSTDQIQLPVGASGEDVILELEVNPNTLSVDAYYTISTGVRTLLGNASIPSDYFSGRVVDSSNLTLAGIYTTHRNGSQFTTNFDAFSIEELISDYEVNINFSIASASIPPTYFQDAGAPFGDRGNSLNYGWLDAQNSTPADLVNNARNRNIGGVSVLNNTLIHMQFGNISTNSSAYLPDAKWEIEIPNGTYNVTVGVGDPTLDGPGQTPAHNINVEGFNVINNYSPVGVLGASTRFTEESIIVSVTDGRLTIDPIGGFNTKIDYVQISSIDSSANPFFTNVTPVDNATNVNIDDFQSNVELVIPSGYELDAGTLSGNVNLYEVDNVLGEIFVPSNSNDTGGGDAITLTPINELKPFTTYVFRLTSGIEVNRIGDINDRLPFVSFESTFITGDVVEEPVTIRDLTGVSFTKVLGGSALGDGTSNERFSSLVIGPDDKLYGSTIGDFASDGKIFRWDIEVDGTLTNLEVLSPALEGSPHPETGVNNNNDRLIIGLAFDPTSTADNLIAYVTHSFAAITDAPEWDGKISRLSGANLEVVQDIVINLPRSAKDHLTNSITFDNQGMMYISQGSNSAGGEIDAVWANRPERLLSAAVLKLDLNKLGGLTLDAYTTDDISVINAASSTSLTMSDGTYNPYAANSPLTIFSTGVRNAYDLVWHSNGWLYVPTNGTAGNGVNSPNAPTTADYPILARRIDGLNSIPFAPALTGGETQKDWLFKSQGGSYHGHPNPFRGEFILNHGGRPYSGLPGQSELSYIDVAKYPSNLGPDPNYLEPAYDFGNNKSPNGVIEYKSNAFDGRLRGLLMVVRFSGQDDLLVLDPQSNGDIAEAYNNIPGLDGGFDDPLDVVEDPKTGNIYISEYDRNGNGVPRITLLRASVPATVGPKIIAVPNELIFEATTNNQGSNIDTKTIEITNNGNSILNITNVTITGTFANQFDAVQPSGATTLDPGSSIIYTVTYAPDLDALNLGFQDASLTITSNDVTNPIFNTGLYGLKKSGYSGTNEPPLQDIVDALGYNINVGWTTLENNTNPSLIGDEVLVQTWIKASQGAVKITPIARYSSAEELSFGWYTNENNLITNEVGILSDGIDNAQQLLPSIISGGNTFDPSTSEFGLFAGSLFTQDALNTGVAHRARIYARNDREGNAIANSYIVAFEGDTIGAYQDYVFVIDNVIPFYSESLSFDVSNLSFIGSDTQEVLIPTQAVTLSGTGGVAASEITLTSSESWLVVPNATVLDTPMNISINPQGLIAGNYQATISAVAPNYNAVSVTVDITITQGVSYAYEFNFQDPDIILTSPAGYMDDLGAPYGLQGAETFGWVLPNTQTPADASANARNRNIPANTALENTFTILGSNNQASFPTRDWLLNLPNGSYYVNMSVGDANVNFTDSYHLLDANNIRVIDFDQENNNPENLTFFTNRELVEVTNGILRVSASPLGNNMKLNYIQIAPVDTSFIPPTITADFVGNTVVPDIYRNSVAISLASEDETGSGSIVRLEYSLDDDNIAAYTSPIIVTDLGIHILNVETEDSNGNITQATYNFTIEQGSGGIIAIENMTKIPGTNRGFPADDYYGFHRIGNPNNTQNSIPSSFHDSNVMRIHNQGTSDLVISDIVIPEVNDYRYDILPVEGANNTFPLTIAAGGFREINITFITDLGTTLDNSIHGGSIQIISNADNESAISATLNGSYTRSHFGVFELDPQDVIDVFGLKTDVSSIVNTSGTITPPNAKPGIPQAQFPRASNVNAGYDGDLVLSSTFVQADPSQPVRAFHLAAFAGLGNGNSRFVSPNSTTTVGGINFIRSRSWYSTLLPRNDSGIINNDAANSVNGPFRIQMSTRTTSGGTNVSGSNPGVLYVRMYKVRDRDGNIIPNEYIGMQDSNGGGGCSPTSPCDWNDNMFYYINIRPENTPSASSAQARQIKFDEPFNLDFTQYFNNGFPGNELEYTALLDGTSPLPSWMQFNLNNNGEITGTAPSNTLGETFSIVINATDIGGIEVSTTLNITVVEENVSTETTWVEDFNDLSNGTTVDNGDTAWTSSRTGGSFSVQNGAFVTTNNGETGNWTSEVIPVNGTTSISIDINDGDNNKESSDFIRAFYIVDGGSPVQFGLVTGNINAQTFTASNITASTIQIIVEARVSFSNEIYIFDNVALDITPATQTPSDLPWVENFSGLNNATVDNGDTAWNSDRISGTFTVQNGAFTTTGSGGIGNWSSEVIQVSGAAAISIDINDGDNTKESNDFIRAFYIVDGGNPVQFGLATGNINAQTFTASNITANTIQIIVEVRVSFTGEFYFFDNVSVTSPGGSTSLVVNLDDFTSLNDIQEANTELILFPNPASNETNIILNDDTILSQQILIFDVTGRNVMAFDVDKVKNGNEYKLYIEELQSGMYFIRTIDDMGRIKTTQLIVRK